MDTVLVSLVSVFGTAVGAILTAVITARSERRREVAQNAALRQTQEHEWRVESMRWLRERRHGTYLAFLEALSAADRANQEHYRHLSRIAPGSGEDEQSLREIRQLFKTAEAASHAVMLEGPEGVAEAAQALVRRLSALVVNVREYARVHVTNDDSLGERSSACHENGMDFIAAHKEFVAIARGALDGQLNTA
ncbi:hypothetical protein [Streptomyces sp. NPDC048172]|uniref:hypothetical protein n=1 Tax=Streptomyces sp. NPDC048172 TaxID=3365505 RepID=UPI0037185256